MTAKWMRRQLNLLKPILTGCSLDAARKGQDRLGELMTLSHRKQVQTESVPFHGFSAAWVRPKDELRRGVLFYVHGGGYNCGNPDYAKGVASLLAMEFGITVFCVAYRLAPEFPYPAALDDVTEAYRFLLSRGFTGKDICLFGESAGGGLIFSLCMKLRNEGMDLPAGIVALSPWTDLTFSGASYAENETADPSLSEDQLRFFARNYAVDDGKNAMVSPLFGDLTGLPPTRIFAGGDEILRDDSVRMKERLISYGVDAELTIHPGMWHAYLLYGLKENRKDWEQIGAFLTEILPLRRKLRWMRLDNAAKIYPAAKRRGWNNLFRLSVTLTEPVDRDVLRSSLDVTLRRFPSIAVRLRRGVFWYYLEEIPRSPQLLEESSYPLRHRPFADLHKYAFRVIAYENRIAVEFFHAVTDGTGGLIFLKTLTAEYLKQRCGAEIPAEQGVLDRLQTPQEEELEDSFLRRAGTSGRRKREPTAFRIDGTPEPGRFLNAVTLTADADAVYQKAKEYEVTVTEFLTAVFMRAILDVQKRSAYASARKKPVRILVPINLRRIFASQTLRNFALYVTPEADPCLGEYTFEELCSIVHHCFGTEGTEKQLRSRFSANVNSERTFLLKIMPLFVKNIAMKAVFDATGEKKACLCLSNLGAVTVPAEMERYVRRMDFILGIPARSSYNCGVLTYGGKLRMNFVRDIREPLLESQVQQVLASFGVRVKAESNRGDGSCFA